jgi:hypothetical protein
MCRHLLKLVTPNAVPAVVAVAAATVFEAG